MTTNKEKKVNKNKAKTILFYSSLLNNLLIASLIIVLMMPKETNNVQPVSVSVSHAAQPEIKTSVRKKDLQSILNTYIDDALDTKQGHFSVSITDEIVLNGDIFAFGIPIPLTASLNPVLTDQGDVILEIKEISLGLLELTESKALDYLVRLIKTPDWLYIDTEQRHIFVGLSTITFEQPIRITAEAFDLEEDRISFTITVLDDA